MGTTVWVEDDVRAELRRLQHSMGAASVNAVLRRVLGPGPRTAQALFADHYDAIGRILRLHRIAQLVAFGSRARGDARPDSDLDVALRLAPDAAPLAAVAAEADLEELLGLPVRIVELPNPRLDAVIAAEGVRFG